MRERVGVMIIAVGSFVCVGLTVYWQSAWPVVVGIGSHLGYWSWIIWKELYGARADNQKGMGEPM